MRVRLVLVTAVLTALSLVVAGPASAAAVTKRDVVRSLLTPRNLSDGWHKTDLGSGPASDVQGCEAAQFVSKGVRHKASRDFQYADAATFITENVSSFWTQRGARRDFNKGTRAFASCSDFTIDGMPFTMKQLQVNSYADQIVLFRAQGTVTDEAGDVPVTIHTVVTRWGRQETGTSTMIFGALTPADLRELKTASVRIAKMATAKVADRLGR